MKALLGALVAASLLAGCADGDGDSLAELFPDDIDPTLQETALDDAADEILPADTDEERALRLCWLTAWTTERWRFDLLYTPNGPQEISTAYTSAQRMAAATQRVKAAVGDPFFGLAVFYAVVDIKLALRDPVFETVRSYAGDILSGNWKGLAQKASQAAGEASLTRYMLIGVRQFYARVEAGDADLEQGWTLCMKRVEQNLGIIKGYTGLVS